MRLTILIPAMNEERRLGPTLDAYLPFFDSRLGDDVEILIVINGSTDGTEAVVAQYAARYRQVRAVVEPGRIGKGGAIMLGLAHACGDLVGFVDADGSTPPTAFAELLDRLGDAGAIIASRWCAGARVSPRQPFSRRLASRIFHVIVRLLFGLRVTDSQCGAKLMTRAAVEAVRPHLGITRWAFDVDLLFQLRRAGFAIREIPTEWHDVTGSRVRVVRASTEMFIALVRLRLLYSPFKGVVSFYDWLVTPIMRRCAH